MQDLAAYVQQRRGRQVSNFGFHQCVALANDWIAANGWPLPSGATAGTLSWPPGWVRLPLGQAQPGDLIEWHSSLPGSNGDGHIGVYLGPLNPGFQSFDQNWSCYCSLGPCPCCCLITHHDQVQDLPYVAGAWRWSPAPAPTPVPSPPPPPSGQGGPSWPLGPSDLTGVEP